MTRSNRFHRNNFPGFPVPLEGCLRELWVNRATPRIFAGHAVSMNDSGVMKTLVRSFTYRFLLLWIHLLQFSA